MCCLSLLCCYRSFADYAYLHSICFHVLLLSSSRSTIYYIQLLQKYQLFDLPLHIFAQLLEMAFIKAYTELLTQVLSHCLSSRFHIQSGQANFSMDTCRIYTPSISKCNTLFGLAWSPGPTLLTASISCTPSILSYTHMSSRLHWSVCHVIQCIQVLKAVLTKCKGFWGTERQFRINYQRKFDRYYIVI